MENELRNEGPPAEADPAQREISTPRLAHIGIAVRDLERASQRYARLLGCPPSEIEEVKTEGVRLCFFDIGNCRIELLQATRPESPIAKFLESGRSGVHHLALSVVTGDLAERLDALKAQGIPVLDEEPRAGAEDKDVFFVHPRGAEGVLIEFLQQDDRDCE